MPLEILGVPDVLCQIAKPTSQLVSKYYSILIGMQPERDRERQRETKLHRAQTVQQLKEDEEETRMKGKEAEKRVARVVSSRRSDSRSHSSSSSSMCSTIGGGGGVEVTVVLGAVDQVVVLVSECISVSLGPLVPTGTEE